MGYLHRISVAGRQHGHGLQRQSAGATVDGDFFASRIHGKAKIKWVSGNYIDGDFFDDQAHGQVSKATAKFLRRQSLRWPSTWPGN